MLRVAAVAILVAAASPGGSAGVAGASTDTEGDTKFGVWQNRAVLDSGGILTLWWNSTSARQGQDDFFTLRLEGATHGYLGFGLSPHTGTMAGADLVVAWVDEGNVPNIRVSESQVYLLQNGKVLLKSRV